MGDLRSLLPVFLDQLRGQSVRNRELYVERLSGFLDVVGHLRPSELSRSNVNTWLAALRERGLAPATLAGHRQALKGFCRFACGAAHPADHVVIGSFLSRRRRLPPEQAVEAMTAVANQWVVSGVSHLVRNGAIFLLARGSGPRGREIRELRLSEMVNALAAGPDGYGIFRATSLGKTGEAVLCFNRPMAAVLQTWMALRPTAAKVDRLFVTTRRTRTKKDDVLRFRPLSRSAFDSVFVDLAAAAGCRPVRSHALRHRLGDKLTKNASAKVAAMLLNHKDAGTAATAIAFYHHPDQDDVSAALAMIAAGERDGRDRELDKLFTVG